MSPWIMVAIAIIGELIGTTALKYADGMTRLVPSLVVVIGYAVAFWMMSQAMRTLPIGIVYAVWAGVGVAVTYVLGIILFKEQLTLLSVLGTALIIAGVVVLHLAESGDVGQP